MKKNLLAALLGCVVIMAAEAQNRITVKEYSKVFPTYPFSDPSPIPLLTPVYPYFRFDGFTDKAVSKAWKVVEIENPYIRILIMPEIGGKVWTAIDKKTGRPFLYYNHSVKFRDIAMRGPWTSGGLESNFGIVGHTPNCATPVDYIITHEADSSITCTIGALDLLTRSHWRVKINVPTDKAFFTTQAFWYSTMPIEQPYYQWMNAAAKASDDLEFIYPGNKYLGHEGEYASYPVNEQNGKRISWYKNNDFGTYKSYHVWGKYTNFFGTYYHDEDAGMMHYSTHDDKAGKKIWIWGLSDQGMIWEKQLTDTDGQYVEVQSGRLFNQNAENSSYTPFKHIGMAPYQSDSWKEYWSPVQGTKGIADANEYGAFNMTYDAGQLKLYYFPLQTIKGELVIKEGDKVLYRKELSLHPEQTFSDSVKVAVDKNRLTAAIREVNMFYEADTSAYTLQRPVETPKNFDWNTAYSLCLMGTEYMDQKLYPQAEEKLSASLRKDSSYLPALVKMSELMYRNMRYEEALHLAARALSINSMAGDANYYYGLANEQLGHITDAKDGFDLAALDPAYRSAAYTELASLYWKERDMDKAMHYVHQALVYNARNMAALQLQAVMLRYTLQDGEEQKRLAEILALDPLNHFALFEKYKQTGEESDKKEFMTSVGGELPAETYEELSIWYYNQGMVSEAKELFAMSPGNGTNLYWRAFLNHEKVNFRVMDTASVFPFRSETAAIMDSLSKTETNWLLKYHLALIYHDRNRIAECKQLLQLCGNEPAFAPFYAVRAAIEKDSNQTAAEADLQRALQLDKNWRYYKLLGDFYMAQNQYSKALQTIAPYAKAHPDNYITGLLYAKALLFTNNLGEADKVMTKLNVLPFEGATESREVFREIKLTKAMNAMWNKKWKEATADIEQAKTYPAHLGVGKPYEEDIDYRLEDWLSYLCCDATKDKKADSLLQNIVRFSRSANPDRNVQSPNALVTVWAYDKLNNREEGTAWLQQQLGLHPKEEGLLWAEAHLSNPSSDHAVAVPKNRSERLLLYLLAH